MYSIKGNQLSALLQFVPKKDIRYSLNGIYFDPKGYAVATDGHAMLVLKIATGPGAVEFIMPRDHVEQMVRIAATDDDMALSLDGGQVVAIYRGATLTKSPIDGKFPDWRRVIPREFGNGFAAFDPKLAMRFSKAASLLSFRRALVPTFHTLDKVSSALVRNLSDDDSALGVVMPYRVDEVTPDSLAATVREFLGENPNPPSNVYGEPKGYARLVRAYETRGMCTSDAQGAADVVVSRHRTARIEADGQARAD